MNIKDFIPYEKDFIKVMSAFKMLIKENSSFVLEFTIKSRLGEFIPVEAASKSIIEEGEITGVQIALRDISERIRRDSEIKLFKSLSDSAGYGVVITDLTGKIIYINRQFAIMHGYEEKEIVGGDITFVYPDNENQNLMELGVLLFEKGYYDPTEVLHIRKNGMVFPVIQNAVLLKDYNDTPSFIAITGFDISGLRSAELEKRRLDKELEEKYNLLRTIFETIPNPMFYKDRDRRYREVNRAYLDFYSINGCDVIGKTAWDILEKERAERIERIENSLLESGKSQYFETKFTTKDGIEHDLKIQRATF
jgi:PAS domain S-box-containing protein